MLNVDVPPWKARLQAAIILALITPVLTELFSTNMGPGQVLRPGAFLFLFFAYSVPILLIRELAVRARVGLPGLFLMGLAYGIFNEGPLAKTLFFGMPGGGLDAYATISLGRIHVVWAAIIIPWHALHAVVFPIALVSLLYPSVREDSWLGRPMRLVFLAGLGVFSVVVFMKFRPEYADWPYFAGFAASIAALLLIAVRLPVRRHFFSDDKPGRVSQVGVGMGLYLVLVVAFFVAAKLEVPAAVLLVWPYGLLLALYAWFSRKGWATIVPLAFMALGDYGSGSLVNLVIQSGAHPKAVDKMAFLAVLFACLALITWRALAGEKGQKVRGIVPRADQG